jgi:hypothetical protein
MGVPDGATIWDEAEARYARQREELGDDGIVDLLVERFATLGREPD